MFGAIAAAAQIVVSSDSARSRFGAIDMSKQSCRDGTATLREIKK